MNGEDKLDKLIRRLQALPETARKITEQQLDAQVDFMADLNREQLQAGLNTDGSEIEPPYAMSTVMRKSILGQPTDKVTLFDYGDFYAGIVFRKFGDIYEAQSTDWKDEMLQAKYGSKILGLSPESVSRVCDAIEPGLRIELYKYVAA
jgi:hypothetical protein